MFEREIQFITDFNLNKVKRLGTFFTLTQLKEAGIHPAIFQFISAEIDDYIYLDRRKLLEKSQFDYSGPVIGDYFSKIADEIKKNKLLPFDSCKRLVHSAVTFNTHFLVNPRLTLTKFIFEDEPNRDVERFKILLNHSYFYDYYREIILRILQKKKSLSVSIEEFKLLIKNIQNELLKTETEEVVENDLQTISEFFNIGEIRKNRLSCEVVHYYLRGRDMKNELEKVKAFLSTDLKQKFDIDEFKTVIFSSEPVPYSKEQDTDEMTDLGFSLTDPPLDVDARTGQFEIDDETTPDTQEVDEEETIRISVESVQDLAMASVMSDNPELSPEQYTPMAEDLPEEELPAEPNAISGLGLIINEEISDTPETGEPDSKPEVESVPATDFSSILDELLADDAPITVTPYKASSEAEQSPLAPFNFENEQAENETEASEVNEDELVSGVIEIPSEEDNTLEISDSVDNDKITVTTENEIVSVENEAPEAMTTPSVFSFDTDVIPEISNYQAVKNSELTDSSLSFNLEIPDLNLPDEEEIQMVTNSEEEPENSGETEELILSKTVSDEMESQYSFSFDSEKSTAKTGETTDTLLDTETVEKSVEEPFTEEETFPEEIQEETKADTRSTSEKVSAIASPQTAAEPTAEDDLLSSFSAKESMTIIKDIFKNNSIDFLETIEKIASCENLMQAQLTLKSVLYAYNINELSETAQLFNRIVTAYFNKKGL